MSSTPFEIDQETMSRVYYNELLTIYAGIKHSEKHPSFESIGITLHPNPSFVITFNDQSGFAFLVTVIEPIRKRYRHGMWSPGKANTGEKMVFSFFTHDNKDYIREFLNALGCNSNQILNNIMSEFTNPNMSHRELITYSGLIRKYSANQILEAMKQPDCNTNNVELLFERYCLINSESTNLLEGMNHLAQHALDCRIISPIKILIKNGFSLTPKSATENNILTGLSDLHAEKGAIELIQFSLRYYSSRNDITNLTEVIKVCNAHRFDIDEPGQPSGKTALHWACIKGNTDIRELLIAEGADPTKEDANETTPDMYYEKYLQTQEGQTLTT